MKITCKDMESMLNVTSGLVQRGVHFNATSDDSGTWTVELTGGY